MTSVGPSPLDPEGGACECADGQCVPRENEGRRCWRSGCSIPEGYFASLASLAQPACATPPGNCPQRDGAPVADLSDVAGRTVLAPNGAAHGL
jgi:hypothetical protein